MEFLILIVIVLVVYGIGHHHGENDFKKYLLDKATSKGSNSFKVKHEWLAVITEEEYIDLTIDLTLARYNEKEETAEWKRAANMAVQQNKPISLFYGEVVTIEGKKQNE